MAGAKHGAIWVTLQAHTNIVAVAALLEMSAVIITEGAQPDQSTIDKAQQEGIVLFSTDKFTYEIVGPFVGIGSALELISPQHISQISESDAQ